MLAAGLLWRLVHVKTARDRQASATAQAPAHPAISDEAGPHTTDLAHSATTSDARTAPTSSLASSPASSDAAVGAAPRPWRDRPFLILLVVIALTGLATDVHLVGFLVWALERLHAPAWVPGASIALLTGITSTSTALVVRWTSGWTRTRTVAAGTVLILAWCAMCAAAPSVGGGWQPVWLLASTVVLAVSAMLVGVRVMAMAEASAPVAAHGRYMATVQYGFNATALLAPLLVGLFAVALWLPWAAVALGCVGALLLLPWLARRLPAHAVRAQQTSGGDAPSTDEAPPRHRQIRTVDDVLVSGVTVRCARTAGRP